MSEHRSERGARIYRLDEFRARGLPPVPIVIEADGTWHRPGSDDRAATDDRTAAAARAAAAARHPSAVARGRASRADRTSGRQAAVIDASSA